MCICVTACLYVYYIYTYAYICVQAFPISFKSRHHLKIQSKCQILMMFPRFKGSFRMVHFFWNATVISVLYILKMDVEYKYQVMCE
jgi:hypothetical protein